MSAVLWLYNMLASYWQGERVRTTDPWNLKATGQFTREWQWFERRMVERYDLEPAEPETTRRSHAPEAEPEGLGGGVGTVAQQVARNARIGATGGVVGTVLMSGGLLTAIAIGVLDPASFSEIGELVGLPTDPVVGAVLFLVGGSVTWPLLFLALQAYLPGRLMFERGLVFASVISTGFAIAFYTGQQGLALIGYLSFVVVAHWAYGIGLTVTVQYLRKRQRLKHGGDA
jgi:cytochrome c oxidase subunit 1